MKLKIEIECENAAFLNDAPHEIDNILQSFISKMNREGIHGDEYKLFDINGNSVGFARFVE